MKFTAKQLFLTYEQLLLGLPDEQTDLGRATKPAAEYLLGLALLTRSYQPFAEGSDASEAETLFTNVIDNYGFTLADNYRAAMGS